MSDDELQTPDFTERLQIAVDHARKTPTQVRDELRELGVQVGDKSMYRLLDGSIRNPTTRLLAGLARVLGTDVRWFCEADEDGELYRALSAYWTAQARSEP